jgi:hypothetical protein
MIPSQGNNGNPPNNINSFIMPSCAEGTCQGKTRRAWTKVQENVLPHGKKIGPVDTQ